MPERLRQRNIDGILDDVFRQYKKYFFPLMIIGLIFSGPFGLMQQVVMHSPVLHASDIGHLFQGQNGASQFIQQLSNPAAGPAQAAAQLLTLLVLGLVSSHVIFPLEVGAYFIFGAETLVAGTMQRSIWTYLRQAVRRWPAYLATLWLLIGLSVAAIVLLMIVIFLSTLIAGLSFGLFTVFSHSVAGAVIMVILLGVLYLFILGIFLWLMMWVNFVFIACFVENRRNWGAISRAWTLSIRSFWRILGITLLTFIVLGIVNMGLVFFVQFIPIFAVRILVIALISILLQPLFPLLAVNLYTDLRVRRDGYDIELMAQEGI